MTDAVSSAAAGTRDSRLAALIPAALIFAVAVLVRTYSHLNTDVSWLLTLGEKLASGARPYVDFLEVNPPASIAFYPAVLAGHAVGVAPELVVNVLVFAAVAASLAFCASLLRKTRLLTAQHTAMFGAVAAFIFLVLPFYAFAQREHIALVAIAPMLCVYAARAAKRSVGAHAALVTGLVGGVAVIIKPYFALALILPFAFVLWRQHDFRGRLFLFFAAENLAATGMAALYAAVVFLQFPAFLHNEMPLLTTLYAPARQPLLALLGNPSCLLFAIGVLSATRLAGGRIGEPFVAVALLAAFGFIAATIIQGKGWPYHGYPAIALVLLVAGNLLVREPPPKRSAVSVVLFVLLALASSYWFSRSGEKPMILQALQQKHISHPGILTVSGDIALGHPLTRELGGHWAGSACSMWVTDDASYLLSKGGLDSKTVQTIERYKAEDSALIQHDIERNRPDIILMGNGNWRDMAMSNPGLRTALGAYRNDETVDGVEIWLRKSGG